MNIGLIGTPGSHKSRLAEQLADHLKAEGKTVAVIDDYVLDLDIALGGFADYVGNLYVALERYTLERRCRREHDVTITCGTMIETAVYLAMHFVALAETLDDNGKLEAAPRIDAILRMMAVLYNDIFDYDHAFYLPPQEPSEDAMFMDQQLQAGLGGFQLTPMTQLIDLDRQFEEAIEALSEVQAT